MPGAHSLLGASGAHRWLHCPGSFALSKKAPHRPSSIYAATGSLAHDFLEKAIIESTAANRLPELDKSEIGQTHTFDGHDIVIDEDFIHGVNVMLDYMNGITSVADWTGVEFSVSLDEYFKTPPPVPLFGRVDLGVLSLWNRTLEICDYKNGAGVVVTPVENPQLLYYAAGVLHLLGVGATYFGQIERIKLTIVQPHAPGAPVRSWETSLVDLLMWVDDVLVPGVHACADPNAPFVPGTWCRFCPVVHACPALHQAAVATAQRDFDEIPTGQSGKPLGQGHALAQALDTAERAQLWIDRLREFALDALQRQLKIPGWGLVPTRPTRKWNKPEDEIAQILSGGFDHDIVWETRLRSPAQLEKIVLRRRGGHQTWDQIAKALVESRSSGVKVGRDQRPGAQEEFDNDL